MACFATFDQFEINVYCILNPWAPVNTDYRLRSPTSVGNIDFDVNLQSSTDGKAEATNVLPVASPETSTVKVRIY